MSIYSGKAAKQNTKTFTGEPRGQHHWGEGGVLSVSIRLPLTVYPSTRSGIHLHSSSSSINSYTPLQTPTPAPKVSFSTSKPPLPHPNLSQTYVPQLMIYLIYNVKNVYCTFIWPRGDRYHKSATISMGKINPMSVTTFFSFLPSSNWNHMYILINFQILCSISHIR